MRFASVTVFLAILGVFGVAGAASAATTVIPDAITSINLTSGPGPYSQGGSITFSGTWAVPDGSLPGGTFTLELPAELSWLGATTFNLEDAAGNVVATGQANADGSVVFTLAQFVATDPDNIGGTFTFSTVLTTGQPDSGPATLSFDVTATVIPVAIQELGNGSDCTTDCVGSQPSNQPNPYKAMIFTDNHETALRSYIMGNDGTAMDNTVTITDTPGAGIANDCASVDPEVGHYLDQWGDIVAPTDAAEYTPTISCTTSFLSVTWTGLPPNENAGVYLNTTITDPNLDSYSNSGTFVVDGTTTTVGANAQRASASGTGSAANASLTLQKSASPLVVATPGQVIRYSFLVSNTGTLALSNIVINDSPFTGTGQLPVASCPEATLAAGTSETCTALYTVTAADLGSGQIANTATASGTPSGSTTPMTSPPSTADVTTTKPTPTITTHANEEEGKVGDQLQDNVTVSGTDGLPGSVFWQLHGPIAASGSERCSLLDYSTTHVIASGTIPISGDGIVSVGPAEATAVGCYSWSETLVGGGFAAAVTSAPGIAEESTLIASAVTPISTISSPSTESTTPGSPTVSHSIDGASVQTGGSTAPAGGTLTSAARATVALSLVALGFLLAPAVVGRKRRSQKH